MFNKNIFQVWYQGKDEILNHPKGKLFFENSNNWKKLNPLWNYIFVDKNILRNACKLFSKECLELYDSFEYIHLKIDLGRYVLLYLCGGIYVDMDMYILRSLDNSNKINNFIKKNKKHKIGFSILNLNSYESILFSGYYQFINNAMIISTPKHPLLFNLINTIIKNSNIKYTTEQSSFIKIHNITGPLCLNNFIQSKLHHKKHEKKFFIEIFKHYYFEPKPSYGLADIRDSTIAIHQMEMSWISKDILQFIKFYYFIKPFLLLITFEILHIFH